MSGPIESKKEQSIDDLIKQSMVSGSKLQIASDDVADKLDTKIHEIDEKKKEEVTKKQAEASGFGYIFLKGFPISPEALSLIEEEKARELKVVCFLKTDTEFRIGAVNPSDPKVMELIKKLEGDLESHGALYQISQQSLDAALKIYATIPRPSKHEFGVELTADDLKRFQTGLKSFRDLGQRLKQASATDMYTIIMAAAIQAKASDVHIESEEDSIKIRFRVDGVLYDVAELPKKVWPKVVNRVKLLAQLKINITDIPQDGRFTIYIDDDYIDVRVSTVPSSYGESIVMRLLMSTATGLNIEDIGLVGTAKEILMKEIERPNGMIITTGPTGSGKTTTLYSILKKLNKPETKIITLENPVEYRIEGITQSQVESSGESQGDKTDLKSLLKGASSSKRHFTFASGLRAVLRQDPDIVLVGEIRDQETAEIAIQAALTGHLMLSTLHTNSAAGAIPRFLSMDVRPFLLAPALNLIIGQRLVRRICSDCKEEYTPKPSVLERVHSVLDSIPEDKKKGLSKESITFYHGTGCDKCNDIGFKGRVGIFELLTMNKEIEELIMSGKASEYQVQQIAEKNGMLSMVQDGILKVGSGLTTAEEVFKVTE